MPISPAGPVLPPLAAASWTESREFRAPKSACRSGDQAFEAIELSVRSDSLLINRVIGGTDEGEGPDNPHS